MSDRSIKDQPRIFPRNLTARASTVVRGNPANARPESGVDNCHPGLEFDQRNIDQVFFPGLRFEFQFLLGAKLVAVDEALVPELKDRDAQQDIYLWYLFGSFGTAPDTPQLVNLLGLDGYEVLRRVRDLEQGALSVVIGQAPDVMDPAQRDAWGVDNLTLAKQIVALTTPGPAAAETHIVRDNRGRLLAAILAGQRAALLENGVIAPDAIQPGDLTRSLCAPWQWDFADCGCHYWASNKPDLVMGADGDATQNLNFQRLRALEPPAKPATTYGAWTSPDSNMSQPQMITGWETLPIVIGECETSQTRKPAPATSRDLLRPDQVVEELTSLAAVEHALCVEYLYAHYSINAPMIRPVAPADTTLFDAAHKILSIAIDEMRHFQWVNEALILLGAPICLDRADRYGRKGQCEGEFKLAPLSPERLDFFIAIEAPSKNPVEEDGRSLDGYYTHILESVASWKTSPGPGDLRSVREVIKLIIDEGHEHFERFTVVKNRLAGQKNALRIGELEQMPDDTEDGILQALADSYYQTLLAGLRLAFSLGEETRNALLKQARRSMHNLHAVGHVLANHRVGLLFTMPNPVAAGTGPAVSETTPAQNIPLSNLLALRVDVDERRAHSGRLLDALEKRGTTDEKVKLLVKRQRRALHEAIAAANGAS